VDASYCESPEELESRPRASADASCSTEASASVGIVCETLADPEQLAVEAMTMARRGCESR
jgi:hypothetical protein